MAEYNVQLLPAADADLDDIFLDNPNAASEVLDRIVASLHHLEDFPFFGTKLIGDSLNQYEFRMVISEPYIAFIVLLTILYSFIEYCMVQGTIFRY